MLDQEFGDQEAEHAVTQEFQLLVVRAARTRMRQRALDQGRVFEAMSEPGGSEFCLCGQVRGARRRLTRPF
jgi:hypothetical protein